MKKGKMTKAAANPPMVKTPKPPSRGAKKPTTMGGTMTNNGKMKKTKRAGW